MKDYKLFDLIECHTIYEFEFQTKCNYNKDELMSKAKQVVIDEYEFQHHWDAHWIIKQVGETVLLRSGEFSTRFEVLGRYKR